MMGKKAASMGTLGLIKGTEAPIPSPNTTPNAVTVQRELSELKNEGYEYVATRRKTWLPPGQKASSDWLRE